jgi:hypothetical protein
MIRRIPTDAPVRHDHPTLDRLKAIAVHIDLDFDVYSAGRLSVEDMKWDAMGMQNKDGKRFRIRYD